MGFSSLNITNVPLSAEVLLVGVFLGIGAVFTFFPLLLRFLPILRRAQFMHNTPLSDVPGCPEHYDEAIISSICTLPDPNNFLTVYSYLPLGNGVRFRHPKMPKCRYFSVSLYAGLFDPVQDKVPPGACDTELAFHEDGSFDMAICDEKDRPADITVSNWMPRQGVLDGLLVVRRYGTLPGQRIDMPSFWSMHSDGPRMLKPSYTTFSGPQYAEKARGHRYNRLLNLLFYLGVAYVVLLLVGRWSVAEVNAIILLAAAMPAGLMRRMYANGLKKANAMCERKTQGQVNVFMDPTAFLSYDSASAKPHPEHKYFCCVYDARQGDVVITGIFFPGQQKIWTFVVYNDCGLPHYHNFTDETIFSTPTNTTLPSSGSSSSSSSSNKGKQKKEEEEEEEKGGGSTTATAQSYRVVLTTDASRMAEGRENVVDVSGMPNGAVILRIIYPTSQEVFEQSKPTAKLVPLSSKKQG